MKTIIEIGGIVPLHVREGNKTDVAHYQEVVVEDCYGLDPLAAKITPSHILDLGCSFGDFSALAKYYWPNATITAADQDPAIAEIYKLNNPDARLHIGTIGARPNASLESLYVCHPDHYQRRKTGDVLWLGQLINPLPNLLKIDIEGGEVDVVRDLLENNLLKEVECIIGEWHYPPAMYALRAALEKTHDVKFTGITSLTWGGFTALRHDADKS